MILSLSRRIALIISGIILVVSLGLGLIATKISSDSILDNTKEALTNAAKDGVKLIEASIEKDLSVLGELAVRPNVTNMDWKTQSISLASDASRVGFLDIGVVSPNGVARYISDGSTADLGERDYIKNAFQGNANISDVIISKVTNSAVVMLAVPIESNNKVVGVLIARKDGTSLSQISEDLGFGENGYSFILGADGVTYAHDNNDFVMDQKNILVDEDTKELGLALQKLGTGNSGVIDYNFVGSKRLMGVEYVQSTGWMLAVGAYESDVLAGLNKTKSALVITTIIFMILGIGIALYFGSSISKPIVEYSGVIERLANYDLSFDENSKALRYLSRKDEIGVIGNSLVNMQKNLVELIGQVSEVSQQVASSSEELTATSQQSSVASDEIARAIEDIATGASEQAKNTEDGAKDIEELGQQIEINLQGVENLHDAAERINILKDEGLEIVKDLVERTKESGKAAGGIYNIILDTNESADKIENASAMIESIAEQTNLLALNAAIEAARAGEAGRGFSVVADEIRKLAEQSNKFTGEIGIIIQELSGKIAGAVTEMEEVKKITESQSNSVDLTNDRFMGIANAIEEIRELTAIIDESERRMEGKKDQVIQVIQNLSAISEENAAGTEEASASVEEQTASMMEIANASEALANLANEMLESIIKFKL